MADGLRSAEMDEALDLISKPYEYEPMQIRAAAKQSFSSIKAKTGELVTMERGKVDKVWSGTLLTYRVLCGMFTVFGMVSTLYFSLAIFQPNMLLNGSLDELTDLHERMIAQQIGQVCYNKIPFLNHKESCNMWENERIGAVTGFYRDYKPFKEEAETTNKDYVNDKLGRKFNQAGMAKPVNP